MKSNDADDVYERLAARELEFEERQAPPASWLPHRLPDEGHVAGVCAGLSRRFGIDVRVIRLLFVVLTFASGVTVIAYIALWLMMAPRGESTVSLRTRDVAIAIAAGVVLSVILAIVVL